MSNTFRYTSERMNWNVWSDITSSPVYGDGYNMKDKPNRATEPLPVSEDTSITEGTEESGDYVIPENDKIIKVNTKTVKCDHE